MICGLTLSHGRGHLYRAMLEAAAFEARHLLEALREGGGMAERFVAVGGGTKGVLWTQIVSDAIGISQELPEQTIGAAFGDALMAGISRGLVEAGTDWSTISEVVEPEPQKREVYEDLYPATRPMAHVLADLQTRGEP